MPPKQRNPGSQPFPRACLPLPTIPLHIRAVGEHRGKMQNSMTGTRKKRVGSRKIGVPKIDRQSRRKMETRRKLIRATVDVMAQKGPDATTIQDITETADVGFGSFYNYFKSKDEIRFAAMEELLDRFGSEIDKLANLIADPVEVFASSMRIAVKTLARRPEWADFLIRVGFDTHDHPRGLYPRMRRDLQIVFKSGRLAVDDPSATVLAVAGAFLSMLAAARRGEIPAAAAPQRITSVALRLLGLPEEEIRRLVTKPLPREVSVASAAKM